MYRYSTTQHNKTNSKEIERKYNSSKNEKIKLAAITKQKY